MFFLDIESLGVESTSVILSIGMLYAADNSPTTYQALLDSSIFIKLNARQQIERFNRVVDKGTIEWWNKQGELPRNRSYTPKKNDLSPEEAFTVLRRWVNSMTPKPKDEICWIRGSLDQMAMDSLCKAMGIEPILPYNAYRDIRTAIDLLYPETGKNGYVEIDTTLCPDYDRSKVLKHSPEHDCAMDACMLFFGK